MNFVDNIVEQLAKSGFEKITKPQSFDMSDDTFSKLLEKQMSVQESEHTENILGEMGMPAGMTIEPYDSENTTIQTDTPIGMRNTDIPDISDVEIKDFKIDNYLSDFLSNPFKQDSPLMNMAMKYATNMYNTQGKSFIDNITDLADGLTGRL